MTIICSQVTTWSQGAYASVRHSRQGRPYCLREIGGPSGRPRSLIDQGASPKFLKRQGGVDTARVIEVAIDQTVEQMAQLEPAAPAGGVRVTHDVYGAAVGQQMIEFGVIGEFVDPRQINQEQPTRIVSRGIEAIEIHWLASVISANAHDVALVAHHVDQFKLLEEGGDGREALTDLGPGLDGNTQRRRVVEDEAQKSMPDRPFGKVGHVE